MAAQTGGASVMSGFYKMDPAAWDFGTANLSLEQEAAYLRIVNAIHKHDGPVPDNDRVLAGLFRTSTRKARSLLDALIEAGKVSVEGGFIWNDRARSDLVHRGFVTISRAESGAKGGRTRAMNAAKALENNNTTQAIASSRIEKNRIDKERDDKSSPKKPSSKRTKLPDDWRLPDDCREYAIRNGMQASKISFEADQFKNYHIGRGNLMADWQAAWRTWVGNHLKFNAPKPVPQDDFWTGKVVS